MPIDKNISQYVLLKLRSGDELIAKKTGSKKGLLIVSRPLQIQRSTFFDPVSGNIKKNICVFRDWLEFTTELECEIPDDCIMFNGSPNPDMISRYLAELEKMDKQMKSPNPPKPLAKSATKSDLEATEDLLDLYFKSLKDLPQPSAPNQNPPQPGKPPVNPPNISSDMVTASFSMPPDVFLNIILNMPLFDGFGQDMGDDSTDSDDGGDDDDSEGEPPSPKPKPPKKKPNKDEDTPPDGWNGRFGFPK